VITNNGQEDLWVASDATAELDKGTPLKKEGGNIIFDAGGVTLGAINGICESGKSTVVAIQDFN